MIYGAPDEPTRAGRFREGPPRYNEVVISNNFEATSLSVSRGFPSLPLTNAVPLNTTVYVYPDFQPNLAAVQWFFDIQQTLPSATLLTIGYNGGQTSHLHAERNINRPATPSATIAATDRKRWPQFGPVVLTQNMLNASYNALTMKVEKRFTRSFTVLSAFTWSHAIDYGFAILESEAIYQNIFNLAPERATAHLNRGLAYNLNFLYELPFGKGKKWGQSRPVNWTLGGWQIGGILTAVSGMPLTPTPSTWTGRIRASRPAETGCAGPNLPASQRSIDRWFDVGFVVPTAPGVISNAGRNLIYGPGIRRADFILSRTFPMPGEKHRLQFRFESFNLTNTPFFGNPNTNIGTAAAAHITSAGEPRRIQFGLKYMF